MIITGVISLTTHYNSPLITGGTKLKIAFIRTIEEGKEYNYRIDIIDRLRFLFNQKKPR